MAHVEINSLVNGIHGTIGGVVFRRHRGRVVWQRKPVFTKPRTEAQLATQSRFSAANAYYAHVQATDPDLLAEYRQRGIPRKLNSRQMAMRDFFNPPTVSGFRLWRIGDSDDYDLVAYVYDDLDVRSVIITLRHPSGAVIATGAAEQKGGLWTFRLPAGVGSRPEGTVEIDATDRPGHTTRRLFDLRQAS